MAAIPDAPAERLQSVRGIASLFYKSMMENMGYGQEKLKDIAEKEAKGEQQQEEEGVNSISHEHERALKGAYRSFVIPGAPKTDIDSYFDQTKLHIKTLIKNQLKEMGSAKIIMTLWVRWKTAITPLIEFGAEDARNAQDMDGSTGDNYIKVEMPFNSLMKKFFEGSNINDLIQGMFARIKTQVENPRMPESGFSLDKIMHLYINFHRLVLIRCGSYTELPKWLKSKKAVINPQNKDEQCFKWAVIEALHHEELSIILRELACSGLMKINITGRT